jgi:flagellar basal-body rod protein FlgB
LPSGATTGRNYRVSNPGQIPLVTTRTLARLLRSVGSAVIFENAISRHTSAPALLRSMDASTLRQKAIADNVANVNTPGYKRVEVSFENELSKALDPNQLQGARTDAGHMEIGKPNLLSLHPKAYRPEDPTLPGQVNDVDIDMEMAKLAENQILFSSSVKFLQDRIGTIRSAIQGSPT